jgi:predicted NodU family carbamoyl transferase
MLENMLWASAFILVCILFYRFALPVLKRFDNENVERIVRQERDKSDPAAHIRHALETAEEQVEPITEIVVGDVTQYLFEAQVYLDRDDAEAARAERIGNIARRFYAELPQALAGRESQAPLSARERAARRWKKH